MERERGERQSRERQKREIVCREISRNFLSKVSGFKLSSDYISLAMKSASK